jgi:hypothetical protein
MGELQGERGNLLESSLIAVTIITIAAVAAILF